VHLREEICITIMLIIPYCTICFHQLCSCSF